MTILWHIDLKCIENTLISLPEVYLNTLINCLHLQLIDTRLFTILNYSYYTQLLVLWLTDWYRERTGRDPCLLLPTALKAEQEGALTALKAERRLTKNSNWLKLYKLQITNWLQIGWELTICSVRLKVTYWVPDDQNRGSCVAGHYATSRPPLSQKGSIE